jgi:mRNA interferase MazF
MVIKQYAVHWINLDPTTGSEVSKTRPCVIISPDEMNQFIRTVIIAPLTHTLKLYPTRIICEVNGDKASIMLDQIRTVDKSRIGNYITSLQTSDIIEIKTVINQMLC